MVIDPICCLTVDKSTERRAHFNGATVYFCSEHCREKFLSAPDAEKHMRTHQGMGIHTCAQHPELWQEDPCDCPKCRIALEPPAKSAETQGVGKSKSHGLLVRFGSASKLVMQVIRGLHATTTGHWNRLIKPPGRSILKVSKGFGTTTRSAQ